MVPNLNNAIFVQTINGFSHYLTAQSYQSLLGQSNDDARIEEALVSTFLRRQVDGLVPTGSTHFEVTFERLRSAGLPIVETWDLPTKPIDMVVGFSNYEAEEWSGAIFLKNIFESRLCR
jgi:LacI family transcriptional regulator, gluconate utilization system Gnt-I transcriptional repressor